MPTVVLLFISDFKAESSCRGSLPRFASYGVTIRTIGSYPAGSLHLLSLVGRGERSRTSITSRPKRDDFANLPTPPFLLLGRTEGFEPSTSESQSNVLPLHYVQHQSGTPPRIQTLIVGVEIRNAIRYTKGALIWCSRKELFILFLAISKYLSSCSIPIKFRFVFFAATPVLPLPIVKSKTFSPSLV